MKAFEYNSKLWEFEKIPRISEYKSFSKIFSQHTYIQLQKIIYSGEKKINKK